MADDEEAVTTWRVVCVKRETVDYPKPHIHIVGVGTGDRVDWADMRWTLRQVLTALDEGETFYTQNETTGQVTPIEKYNCPVCNKIGIRSAAGNTLDGLRNCIYKAEKPPPFSES